MTHMRKDFTALCPSKVSLQNQEKKNPQILIKWLTLWKTGPYSTMSSEQLQQAINRLMDLKQILYQ